MASVAIATAVTMLETLPEAAQDLVVEQLREFISELQAEERWDMLFKKTQSQLIAAARLAKQEIAAGRAEPMDYTRL
jgi:hypothetical protein